MLLGSPVMVEICGKFPVVVRALVSEDGQEETMMFLLDRERMQEISSHLSTIQQHLSTSVPRTTTTIRQCRTLYESSCAQESTSKTDYAGGKEAEDLETGHLTKMVMNVQMNKETIKWQRV